MAEIKQEIKNEQKSGATQDARIFVMPEQYRHGKEAKVVVPEKPVAPVVKVVAPYPPPTPPAKPDQAPPGKTQPHLSSTMKALIIAGVIIILALIVVGYILIRSSQPKEATTPQPQVTQQAPKPEAEEVVIPSEGDGSVEIIPGKDTDSDGLTDVEENIIYKSNVNLPDTDADGFLDGNEVFHLYNPSGTAPGTLLEAKLISSIKLPIEIEFVYPSIWQTQTKEDGSVSVLTTTGESFVMTVRSQTQEAVSQTISDWISEQSGQEKVIKSTTKTGYEFYITQNKRFAVVIVGSTVLSFTYEISAKTTADFVQTFQMMLNSIKELAL